MLVSLALAVAAMSAQTSRASMIGGGDVLVSKDGDVWRVVVTGARAGLASLCIADDRRVRILHASAAVGVGTYLRDGASWSLQAGFDFKLRDGNQGQSPTEAERRDYFTTMGWVANADSTGTRPREFLIRDAADIRFLGVTFLSTSEPMAVSHWPETMDDDCRAMKVAQGYLAPAAAFRPERWHHLK